jgi:hypothetical protein
MFWTKDINKKEIIKWGLGGALVEIGYVLMVVLLINELDNFMPQMPQILGMAFMLLLLVFSVTVSGLFVFGYPAYLVFQKKIKEALATLLVTLITFIFSVAAVILLIYLISKF